MERGPKARKIKIGEKQTRAELRNKRRKIDKLTKAGETVPATLFERVTELQEKLIK